MNTSELELFSLSFSAILWVIKLGLDKKVTKINTN